MGSSSALVEVIQPWLFWFICHFVVTVFTFLPESPGSFYNIVTKTQSCAGSFPRLKTSLLQSQRWLRQWGKVLCKPRDGNGWSLIFHPWGAHPLSLRSSACWLTPPPTFGNHPASTSGVLEVPCAALHSAHQAGPQRILGRGLPVPSSLLSWIPLFSRPFPLSSTPVSNAAPGPRDTLSQGCGRWPALPQVQE